MKDRFGTKLFATARMSGIENKYLVKVESIGISINRTALACFNGFFPISFANSREIVYNQILPKWISNAKSTKRQKLFEGKEKASQKTISLHFGFGFGGSMDSISNIRYQKYGTNRLVDNQRRNRAGSSSRNLGYTQQSMAFLFLIFLLRLVRHDCSTTIKNNLSFHLEDCSQKMILFLIFHLLHKVWKLSCIWITAVSKLLHFMTSGTLIVVVVQVIWPSLSDTRFEVRNAE